VDIQKKQFRNLNAQKRAVFLRQLFLKAIIRPPFGLLKRRQIPQAEALYT
jgi:hypothetical protein